MRTGCRINRPSGQDSISLQAHRGQIDQTGNRGENDTQCEGSRSCQRFKEESSSVTTRRSQSGPTSPERILDFLVEYYGISRE